VLRGLLNLLTLLSLLLCLAVAGLWVRSHWRADTFNHAYQRDGRHGVLLRAEFNSGTARISRYDAEYVGPESDDAGTVLPQRIRNLPWWHDRISRLPDRLSERLLLGFGYERTRVGGNPPMSEQVRTVTAPLWVGVAVFGILPLLLALRLDRRRRRAEAGLCACCGYDLRASPGRCPECGEAK
jgi:hypothetical protein